MGNRIGRQLINKIPKSKPPSKKLPQEVPDRPSIPRLNLKTIHEVNMKSEELVRNMSAIEVDRSETLKTQGVVPTPAPVRYF